MVRFFALFVFCACASADTIIVTPASTSISYAVNDGANYYVSDSPITTAKSFAGLSGGNLYLVAGWGADDSAFALFFHGGFELGYLNAMTISASGTISGINLRLDTGGNGQFFEFSGTRLAGQAGDSYAGIQGGGTIIAASTPFYMFAGPN